MREDRAGLRLVLWLHIWGAVVGYTRYQHLPTPEWLARTGPFVFAGAGLAASLFLALLLAAWLRLVFQRARAAILPAAPRRKPHAGRWPRYSPRR